MPLRRAFTLIELLVVISIIALLIAILLPALGKARISTQRTQCLVNQRSVAQASTAWATEIKGYFPWSVDPDTGHTADAYDIRSIYGNNADGSRRGRATYTGAAFGRPAVGPGLAIESGHLEPGSLAALHCPSVDTLPNPNNTFRGIMMDLDRDDVVFKGGSAWYKYPLHRIITSYNYRGISYQTAKIDGGNPMRIDDINSEFMLFMDSPDMRNRGPESLYNAHGGYNFMTGDGSGDHFADTSFQVDYIATQMVGPSGNVDGRRTGTNPFTGERENHAEAIFNYIIEQVR
jgi:prepilin-type N-terminal cleavage/methylation domain-containing protein